MRKALVDALLAASNTPGTSLAQAAFVIARIEYPRLDPDPYLSRLDAMGAAAQRRIEQHAAATGDPGILACVTALNAYLFGEEKFVGNRERYEDPRAGTAGIQAPAACSGVSSPGRVTHTAMP